MVDSHIFLSYFFLNSIPDILPNKASPLRNTLLLTWSQYYLNLLYKSKGSIKNETFYFIFKTWEKHTYTKQQHQSKLMVQPRTIELQRRMSPYYGGHRTLQCSHWNVQSKPRLPVQASIWPCYCLGCRRVQPGSLLPPLTITNKL